MGVAEAIRQRLLAWGKAIVQENKHAEWERFFQWDGLLWGEVIANLEKSADWIVDELKLAPEIYPSAKRALRRSAQTKTNERRAERKKAKTRAGSSQQAALAF